MNTPKQKKMYVLVREDLSDTYRGVQGGHALSLYALEHYEKFRAWNNGDLIYLGVPNLKALRKWIRHLTKRDLTFSAFCEPDLDGHMTAIACYDTGEIFHALPTA